VPHQSSYVAAKVEDELYPASRWKKHVAPEKTIHSTKGKRAEAMWVNYEPFKREAVMRLFAGG
jgi:hypothetical protein